jgi:hypothetical protein
MVRLIIVIYSVYVVDEKSVKILLVWYSRCGSGPKPSFVNGSFARSRSGWGHGSQRKWCISGKRDRKTDTEIIGG